MTKYKVCLDGDDVWTEVTAVDPYHAAELFMERLDQEQDEVFLNEPEEVNVMDQFDNMYYLTVVPQYTLSYQAYERKE